MQLTLTPNGEESILSLNGEVDLLHVEQLKTALIEALDASSRVIIDTRGLTAIDLAGLQLFCSAHQSALARGKTLALHPLQSEIFRHQIARSGLVGGYFCNRERDVDCLWNGGDQ